LLWLSSVDDSVLKQALTSVRAVVKINGNLRPQESPDYQSQTLIVFLAELSDETAARSLFRLSQEKGNRPNDFAMVGVTEGRLFCLAVERSFMAGKTSFETPATMRRFSTGIVEALKSVQK